MTPPPKIEATIPGYEAARVQDVQAVPFSWTTIDRALNHPGVTIHGYRVISSLSHGPTKERVRMVDGENGFSLPWEYLRSFAGRYNLILQIWINLVL